MAKLRIVPPVYFLVGLLLMVALHLLYPNPQWIHPRWKYYLGIPVVLVGLVLNVTSARMFIKRGTPLKPFEETTTLVATGPFRFSRNPMYLGFVAMLVGTGILLGSVTPLLVPPVFAAFITFRFIMREEELLTRSFGEAYLGYKKKVRRWL